MKMNMNNLRIFAIVADKLNITEASKELFISQPAVSKAVKNLETSLNVRLFLRDKHHGLVLTETGKEILALARQMLALEDKIVQIADQENNLLRGKVKIGSFPAASTNLLPDAISLFRSSYPLVRIELAEGTSSQIKEWVEHRTVDVGIVASPFDGFDFEAIIQDHMVAVIPKHHPLQRENKIDIEAYRDEIIYCKGGHETALSAVLLKNQIALSDNLTVQTADTLLQLVAKNLGIGIISNFTLSSVAHDLLVKDTHPKITRDIGIISRSFEEASPAVKKFVDIICRLSRDKQKNSFSSSFLGATITENGLKNEEGEHGSVT